MFVCLVHANVRFRVRILARYLSSLWRLSIMSDMARASAARVSSSLPKSFPTWMSCEPTTIFMPANRNNRGTHENENMNATKISCSWLACLSVCPSLCSLCVSLSVPPSHFHSHVSLSMRRLESSSGTSSGSSFLATFSSMSWHRKWSGHVLLISWDLGQQ